LCGGGENRRRPRVGGGGGGGVQGQISKLLVVFSLLEE